jgi:hypothetical protein
LWHQPFFDAATDAVSFGKHALMRCVQAIIAWNGAMHTST